MWFKSKDSELEKHLLEIYADMKASLMGISNKEARQLASKLVMLAKERVKEYGFDRLPSNFGDYILQKEKEDPKFMKMNVKRRDGVRDADIKWFWNMHPLERCMLEVDDENTRLAAFMHHSQQGMSADDAANKLRKFNPIFGDPEDTKHVQGEDRPLPVELKDRINKWVQKNMPNAQAFKDELQRYSTMNTFIRVEIKKGNI
jgi:hypothetical protein